MFYFPIDYLLLICIIKISSVGIPRMRWFGREGEYQVLVMDLLGSNLEELLQDCDHKFKLRTVLMLAGQMVKKMLKSCWIMFTHFPSSR